MDTTQQDIDARATAPRVTPADVQAAIAHEVYFNVQEALNETDPRHPLAFKETTLGLLTICVLVLHNGIKVVGESACVSPENFDAQIGRNLARVDAERKIWPLLGFRLADKVSGVSAVFGR